MMTNKEAINLLRGLEQSLDGYCELNDEGKKAFNMAVSALELFGNSEQLPSAQPEIRTQMSSANCISRQAAIDAISSMFAPIPSQKDMVEDCLEIIKNLPPAQPERKKGCKIVKSTGRYGYCACDQCGKPVHPEDLFCSKCGADFREEDT